MSIKELVPHEYHDQARLANRILTVSASPTATCGYHDFTLSNGDTSATDRFYVMPKINRNSYPAQFTESTALKFDFSRVIGVRLPGLFDEGNTLTGELFVPNPLGEGKSVNLTTANPANVQIIEPPTVQRDRRWHQFKVQFSHGREDCDVKPVELVATIIGGGAGQRATLKLNVAPKP